MVWTPLLSLVLPSSRLLLVTRKYRLQEFLVFKYKGTNILNSYEPNAKWFWLYWIAEMLGGAFAAGLYRAIHFREDLARSYANLPGSGSGSNV